MANDKENTNSTTELRRVAVAKVDAQAVAADSLDGQDVKRLYHELQIHQVELEMQNEELTRTKLDLEATRDSYFDLYDLAPVGYLTLNKDGLIQRANLTAVTMLGLEKEALINTPILNFIFSDDVDSYYLQSRSAIEASENFELELRFVQSEGSPLWVNLQASLQHDDVLWITFSDITKRKLAEEAFKQLNDELRAKDEILLLQSRHAAMGEMIANISHQWRQPLNILGMQLQQLQLFYDMGQFNKELLEKNVAGSMEIIKHMSNTIDYFRNYFKPESEKSEFKVQESINSSLSLLEGSLKNPLIDVEVIVKNDPVIYGFPNEFVQVLLNIINNARDAFIERNVSNPKVNIKIFREDRSVVITVADNAGGIHEDIINKVFDPYFTTKGPQQGTGVGLFMSKAIIENNMCGRITARNAADGAEFRIEVSDGSPT